jgi:hypothetical protein
MVKEDRRPRLLWQMGLWPVEYKQAGKPVCHDSRGGCLPEFAARISSMCNSAEHAWVLVMKTLKFCIVPLPTETAERARRMAASGAPDHAIVIANSPRGYPCRHCLRFAQPGERVVLFPYEAIPAGHPYSESGPVFVHAESCERYAAAHEFPADFREGRVMRAYDSKSDMIDAEIVGRSEPEPVIEKLFQNPETAFVDARSVTRGCFTFRIQRA